MKNRFHCRKFCLQWVNRDQEFDFHHLIIGTKNHQGSIQFRDGNNQIIRDESSYIKDWHLNCEKFVKYIITPLEDENN